MNSATSENATRTTTPRLNANGSSTSVEACTSASAWANSSPVGRDRWYSMGAARSVSVTALRRSTRVRRPVRPPLYRRSRIEPARNRPTPMMAAAPAAAASEVTPSPNAGMTSRSVIAPSTQAVPTAPAAYPVAPIMASVNRNGWLRT